MGLSNKDVTGLRDMPAEEIKLILDTAGPMKEIIRGRLRRCRFCGEDCGHGFYEASTRTRGSFELAAKYLSADTVGIAAATSSISKGESLKDTARTIAAMGADLVVLRHPMAGAAELLGEDHQCCGHQRRGRRSRAPHAGFAGPVYGERKKGQAGRAENCHYRRYPAQPGGPVGYLGLY